MGHGGSSGGGLTCVTIAEADGYKTPSLSFPSESKSERELDILNWAYQSHLSQFWPICIKFDFAFSNII